MEEWEEVRIMVLCRIQRRQKVFPWYMYGEGETEFCEYREVCTIAQSMKYHTMFR